MSIIFPLIYLFNKNSAKCQGIVVWILPVLFQLHHNPVKWVWLLISLPCPFFKMKKLVRKKLSTLTNVTQLVSGREYEPSPGPDASHYATPSLAVGIRPCVYVCRGFVTAHWVSPILQGKCHVFYFSWFLPSPLHALTGQGVPRYFINTCWWNELT